MGRRGLDEEHYLDPANADFLSRLAADSGILALGGTGVTASPEFMRRAGSRMEGGQDALAASVCAVAEMLPDRSDAERTLVLMTLSMAIESEPGFGAELARLRRAAHAAPADAERAARMFGDADGMIEHVRDEHGGA